MASLLLTDMFTETAAGSVWNTALTFFKAVSVGKSSCTSLTVWICIFFLRAHIAAWTRGAGLHLSCPKKPLTLFDACVFPSSRSPFLRCKVHVQLEDSSEPSQSCVITSHALQVSAHLKEEADIVWWLSWVVWHTQTHYIWLNVCLMSNLGHTDFCLNVVGCTFILMHQMCKYVDMLQWMVLDHVHPDMHSSSVSLLLAVLASCSHSFRLPLTRYRVWFHFSPTFSPSCYIHACVLFQSPLCFPAHLWPVCLHSCISQSFP